jgi:hypothetical protein
MPSQGYRSVLMSVFDLPNILAHLAYHTHMYGHLIKPSFTCSLVESARNIWTILSDDWSSPFGEYLTNELLPRGRNGTPCNPSSRQIQSADVIHDKGVSPLVERI